MKKSHKQQLKAELSSEGRPEEIQDLLAIAQSFSKLDAPKRSLTAHIAGKAVLRERTQPVAWYKHILSLYVAVPVALLLAVVCVGVASQEALPGDVLYSTKRLTESAQFAVSFSAHDKAERCSISMKRRANELASLHTTRLDDATVQELVASIEDEAEEFELFILQSDTSEQPSLESQRKRDAQYVISALAQVDQTDVSDASAAIIQQTIINMESIISS